MIGLIEGKLVYKSAQNVLLMANGVGYELECPASTLWALPSEEQGVMVRLFVHTHVREDAIRLFGFLSLFDREVFQALISVSSVGPKLALALLGPFDGAELVELLFYNETDRLLSVPGIGQRKLEKLVVDLGPKIEKLKNLREIHAHSAVSAMPAPEGCAGELQTEVSAENHRNGTPGQSEMQLFDDQDLQREQTLSKRRKRQETRALLLDLESALLNMGYKEKQVKSSLEWVEQEWNEGRIEENVEASLRGLLQQQASRLVVSPKTVKVQEGAGEL